MAQPLTWRDVAAPDYRGVQQGINSAAELFNRAATGLSGAATQYGDQQTLQQLAAYSDAQKLQEALQSGQFNTANASPEALKVIQSRAGELITNAGNQQKNSFDALMNPQKLAYQGVLNNQAKFNLEQDQGNQDYLVNTTRSNAATDRTRADDVFDRSDKNRMGQERLTQELASAYTGGTLTGEGDAERMYSAAVARGESPDYLTNLLGRLQQFAPNVGKPIGSLVPGAETSGAVAGKQTSAAIDPTALGNAIYGQESNSGKADTSKVNSQNVTGPMQIQKATFEGLKKNGVIPSNYDWQNPEHNKAAGFAHVADLAKTYKTPEQVAAVYYGGPKAVNADGTINRDIKNTERPNDPTVGQYVDQVMSRALPSKTENALSQQSAVDANTLANASSGSSDAQRLLSVAAESQGKDNSLASVTASLVGKGGVLGNVSPTNVEESLSKVVNALGVNATVAAELVKQAGGSTDREFNLFGAGPIGMQGSVNAERLDALIDQYKKPGQLLNSLRTGAVYAQNATAVTDAASKQKKYDDQVRDLTLLADAGKPGAAEALRVAEEKQLAARLASRDTSQATANAATANLPIDAPPPKKADKPPSASKAAELIAENAPLRSTDGGKTWQLNITPTVRDPSVKYYREIPNPIFVALNNKSFGSRAEAERAYKEALAQKS